MKRFDFLKEHPSFHGTQPYDGSLEYIYDLGYKYVDENVVSHIAIPMFASSILEWSFTTDVNVLHCLTDDLEATPEWFQALVNQAQNELNYRERLRNLFK